MIAIRPPEYFPGLAYAALMLSSDTFVLADTFQYSRQSFQNRTRVRNPEGWQWVSIPLRGGQHGRPQTGVRIRQIAAWRKHHWKAFAFNYRPTPYFAHYEEELRALFMRPWTLLGDLTCASVQLLHTFLGLSSTLIRASDLAGSPAGLPGILDMMGPATLLTLPESATHDARDASSVQVLHFDHPQYRQAFDGFRPGMTAFDALCNLGPEAVSMIRHGIRIEEQGVGAWRPDAG